MKRFDQDFDKVDVIKLRLFEYYKYFKIVIHASITPNPIKSYLC